MRLPQVGRAGQQRDPPIRADVKALEEAEAKSVVAGEPVVAVLREQQRAIEATLAERGHEAGLARRHFVGRKVNGHAASSVRKSETAQVESRPVTRYVALLRAVNVGGTGKLPMSTLKAMCVEAGFSQVETYIASGNVVFSAEASPAAVKAALETRLHAHVGKSVGVAIRTAAEMQAVLDNCPFAERAGNRTVAIFLDDPPPTDALAHAKGAATEEMRLGVREIYVFYGEGMARSKLAIPAAKQGTARNMNTVAKLAAMAAGRTK